MLKKCFLILVGFLNLQNLFSSSITNTTKISFNKKNDFIKALITKINVKTKSCGGGC
jgi:hypothetical protein